MRARHAKKSASHLDYDTFFGNASNMLYMTLAHFVRDLGNRIEEHMEYDVVLALCQRIRRHGSQSDVKRLASIVHLWEKRRVLSGRDEEETVRIMDKMYQNYRHYNMITKMSRSSAASTGSYLLPGSTLLSGARDDVTRVVTTHSVSAVPDRACNIRDCIRPYTMAPNHTLQWVFESDIQSMWVTADLDPLVLQPVKFWNWTADIDAFF